MIQNRISTHQSTPWNPAVFGFLAIGVTASLSVLLFSFASEGLLLGVRWLVLLIGLPLLLYIMWNSPVTAVIFLIAGVAFHGVLMDQWGRGGSLIVHYWKEGFLFCLGLISILKHLLSSQKLKPLVHSRIFVFACVYVAICCFRACFTNDFVLSMQGLATLVLYFILFLTVVLARLTDREISTVLHAILVIAVIVGSIGILEKAFGFNVIETSALTGAQMLFGEQRISSTFGNAIAFCAFVAIGLPIAFSFLIIGGKWLQRLFYGVSLGICLLALFLGYTRGGYLQAGLSMALSGLLLYRKKLVSGRSVMILFAVTLLLVAWSGQVLNTSIFAERFEDFARLRGEVSNEIRVDKWKYYYDRIMGDSQILFLGNGLGTASNLESREAAVGGFARANMPESWVLQLAFEAGVFIMLLFYGLYFICLKSCLSVFRKCPRYSIPSTVAMAGILAGFGVYSLVNQIFMHWMISLCFWLIAGMACVLELRYGENALAEIGTREQRVLSPRFINSSLRARP